MALYAVENTVTRFRGHRSCQNSITVVVVQNEDIVVASTGRRNEFTGLIGENFTSGFGHVEYIDEDGLIVVGMGQF